MIEYVSIILCACMVCLIGCAILILTAFLSPKRIDTERTSAYECGFDPFANARIPFDVSFYLVAILFLVFDIEVAFLLPWVLASAQAAWFGFIVLLIFIAILTVGFIYEFMKGALDWN